MPRPPLAEVFAVDGKLPHELVCLGVIRVPAHVHAHFATYPALALFGLLNPLRWLPLMFLVNRYVQSASTGPPHGANAGQTTLRW